LEKLKIPDSIGPAIIVSQVEEALEFPGSGGMPHLPQTLSLNLADPFSGYTEYLADFLQGTGRSVSK